jgi:hypothetical protein
MTRGGTAAIDDGAAPPGMVTGRLAPAGGCAAATY